MSHSWPVQRSDLLTKEEKREENDKIGDELDLPFTYIVEESFPPQLRLGCR